MKKDQNERVKRVLARGEHSNHAHILIGDNVEILPNGEFIVKDGKSAKIRHLLESIYLQTGEEVWTGEHQDIDLPPGKYRYVPQTEWDPYLDEVRRARD